MLGLQQEVQTITIESAATDTFTPLGFFVVTFEGRSSIPISPTATAWEMQRALEGVLTIDSVHVEVQDDDVSTHLLHKFLKVIVGHPRKQDHVKESHVARALLIALVIVFFMLLVRRHVIRPVASATACRWTGAALAAF